MDVPEKVAFGNQRAKNTNNTAYGDLNWLLKGCQEIIEDISTHILTIMTSFMTPEMTELTRNQGKDTAFLYR